MGRCLTLNAILLSWHDGLSHQCCPLPRRQLKRQSFVRAALSPALGANGKYLHLESSNFVTGCYNVFWTH